MSGMKGERLVCIALLLLCMLAPVPRCQAGAGEEMYGPVPNDSRHLSYRERSRIYAAVL